MWGDDNVHVKDALRKLYDSGIHGFPVSRVIFFRLSAFSVSESAADAMLLYVALPDVSEGRPASSGAQRGRATAKTLAQCSAGLGLDV